MSAFKENTVLYGSTTTSETLEVPELTYLSEAEAG